MASKLITVFFTVSGVPTTGLTPTIDIWEVNPDSLVVTGAAMTEIGGGWYKYLYTSYDFAKSYVFTADGGPALNACERYKIGGNESYEEDISYQVWEEPTMLHMTPGSFGLEVNEIKADTTTIIMNVATAISLITTLMKYSTNRTRIDPIAKTLTVYDNDCITPLEVFDLKDSAGNPSVIEVCDRVPTFCP